MFDRVRRLRRRRDYWKARAETAEVELALSRRLPGQHEWDRLAERWRSLVDYWLEVYGGDRYAGDRDRILDLMVGIMQRESSGMPDAVCHVEWVGEPPPGYDGTPQTRASGLYQHVPAYWPERSKAAGFEGASIFNPNANIAVACYLLWAGWPDTPAPHWHHWSGAHVSAEGSYEWALRMLG